MQRLLVYRGRSYGVGLTCVCKLYSPCNIFKCSLAAHSAYFSEFKPAHINIIQIYEIKNPKFILSFSRLGNGIYFQRYLCNLYSLLHYFFIPDNYAVGIIKRRLIRQCLGCNLRSDTGRVSHSNCNQCLFHLSSFITYIVFLSGR